MKPKRVKLGRKPAMTPELVASVYFAFGRDIPVDDIIAVAGIGATTIARYLNRGLDDPRCERLQKLARQAERHKADKIPGYK